jgi:uncharacterized membrane protein
LSILDYDKQNFPLKKYELVFEWFVVFIVILQFTILLLYWSDIPNEVPKHFGLAGNPDDYGSKNYLLILPIVGLLFFLGVKFFRVIKLYSCLNKYQDKELAKKFYLLYRFMTTLLSTEFVLFLLYLEIKAIQISLGNIDKISGFVVLAFFIFVFGTIIYFGILEYRIKKKNLNPE